MGRIDRATGKRSGGIVGLTSQQSGYVANMRAELADPTAMANYFTRERRDRRFDGLVRKAIADGKPVTKADIDRIAARYADRLLKLRGDTIARTESITAYRAGQHEAFTQMVDSGKVRAEQVIRKWSSAHDSRTRRDHLAMDGTVLRGLDAPFIAPDRSLLRFPGDTSLGASARETIQCRCSAVYSVDRRKVT